MLTRDPARAASQTPQDLLDGGIYKALALALYPGVFWPVSVALVSRALGAHAGGRRGAFQTASAQRAPGELVAAAAADESFGCSGDKFSPPKRTLKRSESELSELSMGREASKDAPGRKSFAKFAQQLTGSLSAVGAGGAGSSSGDAGPASEALPGPNDRRLSIKARRAVGRASKPDAVRV